MKNAFNANLPKASPKQKSAVAVLASPPGNGDVEKPLAVETPSRVELQRPSPTLTGIPLHRTRTSPPMHEAHRSWFRLLGDLEGHLHRAREARRGLRTDVDDARSVLARTAEAAAEALHELATVEKQLQDRRHRLAHLLTEIEHLKGARSGALDLAGRLARLDRALA